MKLFHHIDFPEIDPLGGGLAEEIAAERSEADAIQLEESIEGDSLYQRWDRVVSELHDDPEWSTFDYHQGDH